MTQTAEIVGAIPPHVSNNLGMTGLVIVLGMLILIGALVFLFKYLLDSHANERKEWKADADRREDRAEKRDEKNAEAMQKLTVAIERIINK